MPIYVFIDDPTIAMRCGVNIWSTGLFCVSGIRNGSTGICLVGCIRIGYFEKLIFNICKFRSGSI